MSKKNSLLHGFKEDNEFVEPGSYILYSWKYPDNSIAGALYSSGESVFVDAMYGNAAQWKRWKKKITRGKRYDKRKKLRLSDYSGECVRVAEDPLYMRALKNRYAQDEKTEPTGKQYVDELAHYLLLDSLDAENSMNQVICSRIILISSLLSGAVRQSVIKSGEISKPQERTTSPIMQICKTKNSDLTDFTIKAAKSFCVDTTADKAPLSFKNPPYFPYSGNQASERANAYIEADYGGKKKYRLPTMYRNCSVALNARVLSIREVRSFIHRNPYCSTVIVGTGDLKVDGITQVSAADFLPAAMEWDADILQKMSQKFTSWVFQQYNANQKWAFDLVRTAGQLMDTYGETHKKIKQADRYHWAIRLTTLMALNKFLIEENGWSENYGKYQLSVWMNILLPGCCKVSVEDVPLEERNFVCEADYPDIFFQTVSKMLEDEKRIPYIPYNSKMEFWPICDGDNAEYLYYGYRRWFKGEYPAVLFVRDEFLMQFKELTPYSCDAKEVLQYCADNAEQKYLEVKKARIPRSAKEKSSPPMAVIMRLDRPGFLSEEQRQQLLKPFQKEEK